MNELILGAPSLTGKDANDLVAVAFKDASFPLKIKATNLVAHPLSFPEVSGMYLEPCTHGDKATVVVTVSSNDALQRLASSIEQIAELNHHEVMLEMVAFDSDAELTEESDGDKSGDTEGDSTDGSESGSAEDSQKSEGDSTESAGADDKKARTPKSKN